MLDAALRPGLKLLRQVGARAIGLDYLYRISIGSWLQKQGFVDRAGAAQAFSLGHRPLPPPSLSQPRKGKRSLFPNPPAAPLSLQAIRLQAAS